jgi:hypothetical protein
MFSTYWSTVYNQHAVGEISLDASWRHKYEKGEEKKSEKAKDKEKEER